MDKFIYGADTETVRGLPNTLQFYSEDTPCDEIHFVDERSALREFLRWCDRRAPGVLHVVYIHNLRFDLVELLYGSHPLLVRGGGEFEFTAHGWSIAGIYGTPTFAKLRKGSSRGARSIMLVDSAGFHKSSLKEAAKLYCPHLPKLAMPKDLGQRRITSKNTQAVAYAMRDAEVTYHVGKAIEATHREFEIRQAVSIADMAATIFKHRFLSYTIPQPTADIVEAALDSYHGGKNNITKSPGWYPNTRGLDLSSAYPKAMHGLPAFADGRLYKRFRATRRAPTSVPPYGVYCVSGHVRNCQWPVLFGHDFSALRGDFSSVHIQGLELNEALASGELRPRRIEGWYYDSERDNQAPGLRHFVETFYKLKESESDKVRRHMYKIILNSLYGKFIQTKKKNLTDFVDIDSGKVSNSSELVCGGLFQPFIASAITAHCRARIHTIEHEVQAIHTATDGVFTLMKRGHTEPKALGALGEDVRGDLLMVRNKLYVVYQDEGESRNRSKVYRGKFIKKYALHGFAGSVFDLERLVQSGARSYQATHVNQLKESLNRGLQVNDFVSRDFTLKVPAIAGVRKAC